MGFSIKFWSSGGSSSSSIIFDSAPDSLVDTLLAVLEYHEGVGHPPHKLLQVGYRGPISPKDKKD